MELDKTDLALIGALQTDASQRLEDLARLVQLAPSSVHDRLGKLEREGVIRRWTVDIDPLAVGLGVLAYIGVHSTKPCSSLVGALEAMPEIEECHSVAGELSIFIKVRAASTQALLDLTERLRHIPGIESTETTIVLKSQFERPMALPIRIAPPPVRTRRSGAQPARPTIPH